MMHLFIGGPLAGREIDVDDGCRTVEIPVLKGDGLSKITYRQERMSGVDGWAHWVFVADGVCVIQELVRAYARLLEWRPGP